jgi:hypothetical protein
MSLIPELSRGRNQAKVEKILVPPRKALELTGLSAATLREWTSRRALIPADIAPRKRGASAQFSWQTILVIRIAIVLRDQFCVELQAHQRVLAELRSELEQRSFIGLWDKLLMLEGPGAWHLVDSASAEELHRDGSIIHLDPHLELLSRQFALPGKASRASQLDLFPALAVGNQHGVFEKSQVGREHVRQSVA